MKVWPLAIGWPFRVTFAFWNVPKRSSLQRVRLLGVQRRRLDVDAEACRRQRPGSPGPVGAARTSVGVTVMVTVAGLDWRAAVTGPVGEGVGAGEVSARACR